MADRLSAFRTPADATRHREIYDRFVAERWSVPHTELDVGTRFGTTHVRRSGTSEGTPLLLVHPTSGASLGWSSVIAPFAEHHTVYTPDTIGTAGRSVQTAPVRSGVDLSHWLDDTLDGLGLDSVHLVGYSEGGWIAATHAALAERADRLATLSLIEPSGVIMRVPTVNLIKLIVKAMGVLRARDKARALRSLNRWMNGDIELSDAEIELVLHVFKTFRQRLPRPARLDDDQLRRITAPTLLLLAEDSVLLDPETVAERAERLLPDVTVHVTPDAGHGVLMQYPEEITGRILDFVGSRDARRSSTT